MNKMLDLHKSEIKRLNKVIKDSKWWQWYLRYDMRIEIEKHKNALRVIHEHFKPGEPFKVVD